MVSNSAPNLPACTGRASEYKACWEELLTAEEMVQVDRLITEIAELTARNLTGAMVALSLYKQLTQLIQERVHPSYEYWGREDPTRGQNCKVSRVEALNWVARIMAGQIRDKGCPKALYLKRPTDAISLLGSSE